MCNLCDCENYEKCSIVGNIPLGFCCPLCNYYNEGKACEKSQTKLLERKIEQANNVRKLHDSFGKSSINLKDLKNYPQLYRKGELTICNNCNCDNYEKCSIVGYLPTGFCCANCNLYDESHTCLKTKTKRTTDFEKESKIKEMQPISTSIEDGILKVIIKREHEKIPIFIDLQKHFEIK